MKLWAKGGSCIACHRPCYSPSPGGEGRGEGELCFGSSIRSLYSWHLGRLGCFELTVKLSPARSRLVQPSPAVLEKKIFFSKDGRPGKTGKLTPNTGPIPAHTG